MRASGYHIKGIMSDKERGKGLGKQFRLQRHNAFISMSGRTREVEVSEFKPRVPGRIS